MVGETGTLENGPPRAVLGVENSVSGRRWIERLDESGQNHALALSQSTGHPEILTRLMARFAVKAEEVPNFLDPSLRELMPDPHVMTDMEKAARRLADAVCNREKIAIFGDYDVDGATSSALLKRFFGAYGLDAIIHIPDRIIEGYGPNKEAIEALAGKDAKLLITVDCGTASFEPFAHATSLDLDVVVLDHHQTGVDIPDVEALVNPNRQDDLSGLGQLAAVGVSFMCCVATQRQLRQLGINTEEGFDLLSLLDLVALGTVCDVVPLTGLNRAFVSKGLLAMQKSRNIGLRALSEAAGILGPPAPYHLGFALGPRINAGGRIGDAALGSRLLSLDEAAEAANIAIELNRLNIERQAMEAEMLVEADAQAIAALMESPDQPYILVASKDWHPGVVGLLAARLKERHRRPAFAVAINADGIGTGSGRSIQGVDLGAAVRAGVDDGIFERGGGHAMAAGITLLKNKIESANAYLASALQDQVASAVGAGQLKIDAPLTALAASVELVNSLEGAGPFGAGNPSPVFAFPAHKVVYAEIVGNGHVRCTIASGDGQRMKAIKFRAAEEPVGQALLAARGTVMHLAGTLNLDRWRGREEVQLNISDVALPPK